jgi:hypothetical protein
MFIFLVHCLDSWKAKGTPLNAILECYVVHFLFHEQN